VPALAAPHSEFLIVGILFFALGLALLALAKLWPARTRRPVATSATPIAPSQLDESDRTTEGELAGDVATADAVAAGAPHAITWPALVDPDAGDLEENERRDVLAGLGIVGDRWSTGVLAQAFDEETGALRVAAIEALAMCEDDRVAPMLELAYASTVVEERYAAVDGASRRGEVPLLERGLRDADAGVALAAAHGLQCAGRADLVAAGLAGRDAAEAVEIRRVLAVLH